jgi:magnesium-transporting ATPase (P-type)
MSHAGKGIMNKHALGLPDCPITHVLRDGKKCAIDARDLVLGDIIFLKAGFDSVAPCDLLLIEGDL